MEFDFSSVIVTLQMVKLGRKVVKKLVFGLFRAKSLPKKGNSGWIARSTRWDPFRQIWRYRAIRTEGHGFDHKDSILQLPTDY